MPNARTVRVERQERAHGSYSMQRPHPPHGFTLVEMAIVILLMGIMMTMGISAVDIQLNNVALSSTKRKQEAIRDALSAYLRDYKRLPCPEVTAIEGSAPAGTESRQTAGDPASLCRSYWGTLPFADLGLPRDMAMDGYDAYFTYFVSNARATTEPDWTLTRATNVPGFSVGNSGRFAITENGTATTISANLAVVVLVSHGKNGAGAFTIKGTRIDQPALGSDERLNAPDITALPIVPVPWSTVTESLPIPGIAALVVHDRTDAFDDIVLALRPNDLLQPLIKDGALKSAEAVIQEQLLSAKEIAIAHLLGHGCIPVPVAGMPELPVDPWGQTIKYGSPSPLALTNGTPPGTPAFRVWSNGPNRSDDSGGVDDRVLTTGLDVTFAQVRARLTAPYCP